MSTQQVDPILKKYRDVIEANTKVFKVFYYGDPVKIPVSFMPALIIARRTTTTTTFTNVEDVHKMTLVFTIVTDIRKDISDETTLVPGTSSLYDIMEGRDPTTMLLKSESLLNILRHNIDIDQAHQMWTDAGSGSKIDYGLVMNKRAVESWSIEGSLTVVCSLVQLR